VEFTPCLKRLHLVKRPIKNSETIPINPCGWVTVLIPIVVSLPLLRILFLSLCPVRSFDLHIPVTVYTCGRIGYAPQLRCLSLLRRPAAIACPVLAAVVCPLALSDVTGTAVKQRDRQAIKIRTFIVATLVDRLLRSLAVRLPGSLDPPPTVCLHFTRSLVTARLGCESILCVKDVCWTLSTRRDECRQVATECHLDTIKFSVFISASCVGRPAQSAVARPPVRAPACR